MTWIIGLSKDSGEIDIRNTVEDLGLGVPQGEVSHIFCDFYQMEETYSRQCDGTALGLSIIQRLNILMNGAIWFESDQGK